MVGHTSRSKLQESNVARTLEPIKHGDHVPQPLNKGSLKKLKASHAWKRWTKFSGAGAVAIATYGYNEYLEAGEEIGNKLAVQAGLCRRIQGAISNEGNKFTNKATFKYEAPSLGKTYDVRIISDKGKCWITASHAESHFSVCLLGYYDERVEDISIGQCPAATLRSGCDCTQGIKGT